MRPTQIRLEEAEKTIREPSFRKNKGRGNEVGYYVFNYPAVDELIVREWVSHWIRKNNPDIDGYRFNVFDLYDTMIDLLIQEESLVQCFNMEEEFGLDGITEDIGNILGLTNDNDSPNPNMIVDYICDHTAENDIVILSGIGKCYPVLRSHTVLNVLHQRLDMMPVILLFPGKYDGQELVLFGNVKDDNYYRALPLAAD